MILSNYVLCNRFDAVHIVPGPENGTFYARAMNLGEAILKVSGCLIIGISLLSCSFSRLPHCGHSHGVSTNLKSIKFVDHARGCILVLCCCA